MRLLCIACAGFFLLASQQLFAAAITPEEAKIQSEFPKAYRVNDKDARKSALSMLDGAKHSSSWKMVYDVAVSDPEADVRLAAVTVLAKEPARDSSVAHMVVQLFNNVKFNDTEIKLNYTKAMAPSEFKYEMIYALVDHISKLRYPDVPRYIPGSSSGTGAVSNGNAKQIENVKKIRKEFEEILEAFNAFAKSDCSTAAKDTPLLITKWFQTNQTKLAAADKELADKYKKEDADAAKAAKEAATK